MATMAGVVFLGDRRLELREFPVPEPGPGQVLVRMKASPSAEVIYAPSTDHMTRGQAPRHTVASLLATSRVALSSALAPVCSASKRVIA